MAIEREGWFQRLDARRQKGRGETSLITGNLYEQLDLVARHIGGRESDPRRVATLWSGVQAVKTALPEYIRRNSDATPEDTKRWMMSFLRPDVMKTLGARTR